MHRKSPSERVSPGLGCQQNGEAEFAAIPVIKECLEVTRLGQDKGGRVTALVQVHVAVATPWSVLRGVRPDALERWLSETIECLFPSGTANGFAQGLRLIIDVGDACIFRLEEPTLLRAISRLLRAARERYPGILYKATIIGAPPLFQFTWAGIVPLLAPATLRKIEIFSSPNAWVPVLRAAVDPSLLPERCGGSPPPPPPQPTLAASNAEADKRMVPSSFNSNTVLALLWQLVSFLVGLCERAFLVLSAQLEQASRGERRWDVIVQGRPATATFVLLPTKSGSDRTAELADLLRSAAAAGPRSTNNALPLLHRGLAPFRHLLVPGLLALPMQLNVTTTVGQHEQKAPRRSPDAAASSAFRDSRLQSMAMDPQAAAGGRSRSNSEAFSAAATLAAAPSRSSPPPRHFGRALSTGVAPRGAASLVAKPPTPTGAAAAAGSSARTLSGGPSSSSPAASAHVASLEGARVRVRQVIGPRRTVTFSVAVDASGESWSLPRTLGEFRLLRDRLRAAEQWPKAEGSRGVPVAEVGASVWDEPPRLPPPQMAQGLELVLQAVIAEAADSPETWLFLGNVVAAALAVPAPAPLPAASSAGSSETVANDGGKVSHRREASSGSRLSEGASDDQESDLEDDDASVVAPDDGAAEGEGSGRVAQVEDASDARRVPGLRPELADMFFDAGNARVFRLRGSTYLSDRVKVWAEAAVGKLLHVDVFSAGSLPRLDHVCSRGKAAARIQKLSLRNACCSGGDREQEEEALFVVNLQVPRTADRGALSIVCYFGLPMQADDQNPRSAKRRFRDVLLRYATMPIHACLDALSPAGSSANLSWEGGLLPKQDFRNQRLKVIAAVHKGPWAIRQGPWHRRAQPAGRRLAVRHFRGATYIEADLDLGSTVAAQVCGAVLGFAPGLVMDLGFLFEGTTEQELPEVLLGTVRAQFPDLSLAEPLYEPHEWPRHGVCQYARKCVIPGEVPWGSSLPYLRPELWGMFTNGASDSALAAVTPSAPSSSGSATRQHSLKVRGADYLTSHGKVAAGAPQAELMHVDVFSVDHPLGRVDHIVLYDRAAESASELVAAARAGWGEGARPDPNATLLIVNFQVPATAHGTSSLSMVCYWRLPALDPASYETPEDQAYALLLTRFLDVPRAAPRKQRRSRKRAGSASSVGESSGAATLPAEGSDDGYNTGQDTDDEDDVAAQFSSGELPKDDFRNERLKLVPLLVEGPWIVRLSMGSTPVLLGQRLKQRHFRGDGYLEVDVDLGSSRVALRAASLCVAHAHEFVAQVGLVIEGRTADELPERLLAAVRLSHLDAVHGPTPLSDAPLDLSFPKAMGIGTLAEASTTPVSATDPVTALTAPPGLQPAAAAAEGASPAHAVEVPLTSPQLQGMFWDSGCDQKFIVRGPSYMRDRVKVPAGPALAKLVRADLFTLAGVPFRQDHVAQYGKCAALVNALLSRPAGGTQQSESFLLILNFQIPASPPLSFVVYYELPSLDDAFYADEADKTAIRMVQHFVDLPEMDPEDPGALPAADFRNERFKIIPNVRDGPWVVRSAVGNKPALLGRKLTQRYFRGDRYLEVDVDVGSSVVAYRVTSVCASASRVLTIDVGLTLEGRDRTELPERVIGCVTVERVDLMLGEPLYQEGEDQGGANVLY